MELITLIILQVVAHLLADFIFQPQRWADLKLQTPFSLTLVFHAFVVGMSAYVLSFDIGFWKGAIALMLIHFMIDMLKSFFSGKNERKNYFFSDQLAHFLSILLVCYLYQYFFEIKFLFPINTKIALIIAGFLFCSKPANIFIRFIFLAFSINVPLEESDKTNEQSLPNAGKLIGIVERFLALSLIIVGQYSAVGFIIAAKSILRFNNPQRNEYILIGTLLSFGMAFFWGFLILWL